VAYTVEFYEIQMEESCTALVLWELWCHVNCLGQNHERDTDPPFPGCLKVGLNIELLNLPYFLALKAASRTKI